MSGIICHESCVMCHVSCVICHVSGVMCQVSCVRCHVSGVMCHVSGVRCHVSDISCHFFLLLFPSFFWIKCLGYSLEGLLSTGPIPASLRNNFPWPGLFKMVALY